MEYLTTTEEIITQFFSHGPVFVAKWVLVFVVVILSFVIRIKFNIDNSFNPHVRIDKKVKKAIEENHVIEAALVKVHTYLDDKNPSLHEYSGDYQYEMNGKKCKYRAVFGYKRPPEILHLYYDKTPKKLFTNEKLNYYGLWGIPLLIMQFSPFIIGAITVWLLGLAG